jgi:hypothetical protein
VPLLHKPVDGWDADSSAAVKAELSRAWSDYIRDCMESDTKPTLTDFVVWTMHIQGFRDGMAVARDDCDDPRDGEDNVP